MEPPYINSIDWSKWHFFWVDERVVPKNDPESNYLLAYDGFLSKVWIALIITESTETLRNLFQSIY